MRGDKLLYALSNNCMWSWCPAGALCSFTSVLSPGRGEEVLLRVPDQR